jgi:serine-type D-Ala-D-Ala carboxypeptidase (penicillin-binding protein 5/6)
MTALVVISETEINEVVEISPQNVRLDDSTMGLINGDKLSVGDLLHGLLINSGSDAALNLATHVAGSELEFVELMNQKAKILGLENTNFSNPVGWDDQNNYSTAKDLTNLARIALTNKEIKSIVGKKNYIVQSENGNTYYLNNTNQLLRNPQYLGIKTGTTFRAGECLVTYYEEGDKKIIGTILNSTGRFNETTKIIKWTKDSFVW